MTLKIGKDNHENYKDNHENYKVLTQKEIKTLLLQV
jgi:hypothetical protein